MTFSMNSDTLALETIINKLSLLIYLKFIYCWQIIYNKICILQKNNEKKLKD